MSGLIGDERLQDCLAVLGAKVVLESLIFLIEPNPASNFSSPVLEHVEKS